jgi:hypothetical protein
LKPAAGLPNNLAGGVCRSGVREGFRPAEYVALNYKPRYLALGIEVNMYFERQPGDFDSFLRLRRGLRRGEGSVSETLVFPTFQLDMMQECCGNSFHLNGLCRRFRQN